MKFEDIKKGDKVYTIVVVKIGLHWSGKVVGKFNLPQEVTKVTAKFFDIGRDRYRKSDGVASGTERQVYNLGDYSLQTFSTVKDDTELYKIAAAKAVKLGIASGLCDRYSFEPENWSDEDLDTIISLLNKNKWSK